MTDSLVRYERQAAVSTIVMDDGKVNALSPAMLGAIDRALDRALEDETVVVLRGRPGRFSGGFDLRVFRQGREPALEMLQAGARLAERMLAFPAPIVIACSGHAIAMGAFLLTTADLRIGVDAPDVKISANEVEIGLTLPRFAIELCRQRLTPAAFDCALLTAHAWSPAEAVNAGFLDRIVPESELDRVVSEQALRLSSLVRTAYSASKTRVRAQSLAALRAAIEADGADWRAASDG